MEVASRSDSPLVRAIDAVGHENAVAHHAYPGPINVAPWSPTQRNERNRWS